MCFLSLRRLRMYFLRRSYSKWGKDEDKVPLKLQDCLDKPGNKKSFCRPYIIVVFIVPIVFYLFYYKQETQHFEITLARPRPVYMEIYPKLKDKVVTEVLSPNINKLFNNATSLKKNEVEWYDRQINNVKHNMIIKFPVNARIQKKITRCVVAHKGNVTIHMSNTKTDDIIMSHIVFGGYYKPEDCRPQHKVGILVPYRDKDKQLAVFLLNIHPFLVNQKIEYRLFVIEQLPKDRYNRGRLLNAGFIEIQKLNKWNCVIFHDLDLLPLDDRIQYSCPLLPRHLSATIEGLQNKTSSRSLFGGVTIMSLKHFKTVNGFSNLYWGFGGEDNDLFWRLKAVGLGVTRLNKTVARYMSLSHTEPDLNPHRFQLLSSASTRYKKDGLTTLEYNVISYHLRESYTHIVIDINPKKENITGPPEKTHGVF